MDIVETLGQYEILGLRLEDVGLSLFFVVAAMAGGKIVEWLIAIGRNRSPDGSVRRALFDAAIRPVGWAIYLAGFWSAITVFPLPEITDSSGEVIFEIGRFVNKAFMAGSVVLATWFAVRLTDCLTSLWWSYAATTESAFDDQLVPIVRKSGRAFFVIVGAVMVVQNLGYSVTSLVAGLGLGGAALALASKDTVANLFGSVVIFVDRPFQIGDWVEIGDVEGTVEEVGLRVTRIRTFANSLITVPNAQLTTTAVNNWSQMKKRRIKLTVGVTYGTSPEKLLAARDRIRDIILADDRLHHDFYLVNFFEFGDSSLNFFIYLFTVTTSWADHMQVREDFLLAIMRAFDELGLDFAFPTRTVHLEGLPSGSTLAGALGEAPAGMARDAPA